MVANDRQTSDRLQFDLSEAIADLKFDLPRMQVIGRELVRELGQVEAARLAQNVLAEKLTVQELLKSAGPGAIYELVQFVIGLTNKLDLEEMMARSRQSG
jgi:hypothetical protein